MHSAAINNEMAGKMCKKDLEIPNLRGPSIGTHAYKHSVVCMGEKNVVSCFSILSCILSILLNAVTADVVSRWSDPPWDTSRCDTVLGPPSPHHPA